RKRRVAPRRVPRKQQSTAIARCHEPPQSAHELRLTLRTGAVFAGRRVAHLWKRDRSVPGTVEQELPVMVEGIRPAMEKRICSLKWRVDEERHRGGLLKRRDNRRCGALTRRCRRHADAELRRGLLEKFDGTAEKPLKGLELVLLVGEIGVSAVAEREGRSVQECRLQRGQQVTQPRREPRVIERQLLEICGHISTAPGDDRKVQVNSRAGLTKEPRRPENVRQVVL